MDCFNSSCIIVDKIYAYTTHVVLGFLFFRHFFAVGTADLMTVELFSEGAFRYRSIEVDLEPRA